MKRPDVEAVLTPLKPFQRRTVNHAFHRLFTAEDSTSRFLVADEVGLGKTLVARGVIARAIDHLWETVDRIDIIYICSNGSIARANLDKLVVGDAGEQSFALATRLTMLATQLAPQEGETRLADRKLNFVSFTPGTSFNMGRSSGQSREREVLFHLLEPLVRERTALMNFLQGGISNKDDWRWRLANVEMPIDPDIRESFNNAFASNSDLAIRLESLFEDWFGRYRDKWPPEARWGRNIVIGKLRQLLAGVCVHALQPDLVILDEFQRFKSLLERDAEQRDPAAELAQTLFEAKTPEGNPVRTLLLSATPYKLYTADAEIEHEDHYADFLGTTRFLLNNDEVKVIELKQRLSRFGGALKRAASGETEDVGPAKRAVEDLLRAVMARTERVGASEANDAMVVGQKAPIKIHAADVHQYAAIDALSRAVGARDPMVLWKSAPYLSHFMRGYKFNERLEEARTQQSSKVAEVLERHGPAFLESSTFKSWSKIDPANAKLRQLLDERLDQGQWGLLWMPPTVPYWPLEGPFAGHEGATKALVFSAWSVVPDVISAVLSYEADRLMAGGQFIDYEQLAAQQSQLLRLSESDGKRARHRLLLLLLPCLPLADGAHPLAAPVGADRREWVRSRVEQLLNDPALPDPQDGSIDDRWEYLAPLLLDPGLRGFLANRGFARAWATGKDAERAGGNLFEAYVADLLAIEGTELGRRPPRLAELLTDVALGSPAIVCSRVMLSAGVSDDVRRVLAMRVAGAFWSLFNRATVIKLLNQLGDEDSSDTHDDGVYWRKVLRYCQHGNLQAVLDEHWHFVWEQHAWSEKPAEDIATRCANNLTQVVQPTRSRVHAQFLRPSADGVTRDELRVRTNFALRFGDVRNEDDEHVSQDTVRDAFNSPFRPFVLASTSVGQEGLDFHPWCHQLVHWNLPGNPVDLEQREGRVHRYKCHAVRRNVADAHGTTALAQWKPGGDLWEQIFALALEAARSRGDSDLVPYWIAPGECRVQRQVPMLPYTAEVQAFARLKRQLAAYRVVFGQPRQEELVTLLERADLDTAQLRAWAVDLSPPGFVS